MVGDTVGGIRDKRLPAWELGGALLAGRRGSSVVGLDWRPGLDGFVCAAAGGLELVLLGLES